MLAVQVVVLGALGLALGARPEAGGILPMLVTLLLGSAAFVALALLLAGTLRAEAVLAIANLVWVVLLGLGVLFPTALLPGALGTVAALLPSGALGDAMRTAVVDGGWPWAQWAVLLVWGLAGGPSPGGSSAGATDRPCHGRAWAAVTLWRDEHEHHHPGRSGRHPCGALAGSLRSCWPTSWPRSASS